MPSRNVTHAARALIVFGKNPVPGHVKTRLTTLIDPAEAAELYRAFLLDALSHYSEIVVDVRLYLSPSDQPLDVAIEERAGTIRTQQGAGLGERMFRAFEDTFDDGYGQALIVGTDSPGLPHGFLDSAFDAMSEDPGAVPIGPSRDGGYYLLGMSTLERRLFEGVRFSTPTVFAETHSRIVEAGFRPFVLPEWFDIDTPSDLRLLVKNQPALEGHERTRDLLQRLGHDYPSLT
jgi:rSAM/selenodomain-associated transferase 1